MMQRYKSIFVVLLATVFLVAATVAAFMLRLHSTNAYEQIAHTHAVIEKLHSLKANVLSCESSLRGYIETGNRKFLHTRDRAAVKLPNILRTLASMIGDQPGEQAKLDLLDCLVQDKLAWQQQVISDYENQGAAKATQQEQTYKGAMLKEQIFEQVEAMEATEKQLLHRSEESFYLTRVLLSAAVLVLSTLGIVFLVKTILSEIKLLRLDEQRKSALEQLHHLNSDLNQQISDLIKAREDLQNAVNTRSQFLANVSHELRTPLAGIIGATEIVLSMPLLEDQRALITATKNCGDELLVLVNDLLDFAKIESPEFRLNIVEFNLLESVKVALEPMELKSKAKGLQFNLHLAKDIPNSLMGDFTRIRQVLINLVDNAIKYTDVGSVSIAVSVRSQTSEICSVSFNVSDTGIGIDPGHLDVIFDRFVQLDGSTTRQQGGAGLGLSISKSLTQLMNGTIEVSSSLGLGSQFTLTIPFAKPAKRRDLPGQSRFCIPVQQEHDTILLVDDSEVIRTVASAQLTKLGFKVKAVCNGEEAVKATSQQSFGLIIMDIQMPVMDGFAATRAIRSRQDNPCRNIPIIAMTAHAMPEDRELSLQSGMSDYMAKPVGLEKLEAMLNKWVLRTQTPNDSIDRVTPLAKTSNQQEKESISDAS